MVIVPKSRTKDSWPVLGPTEKVVCIWLRQTAMSHQEYDAKLT